MNVLWLVSWYPNRNDRFDGDFIQRHARAAAIYHDVHVLFVTESAVDKQYEEERIDSIGLTEQIIYFRKKRGLLRKIRKQWAWKNLFQNAIADYVKRNGLPDCVHVQVPWKVGLIALWMKRKYKTPFIIMEHWGIYNEVITDNFFTRPSYFKTLLKKIFREAGSFTTVSRFLATGVKRILGKNCDAIIPNVVDNTLFFLKEEKYSGFSFIHVSNMVPVKNVKGLLDAFKKLLELRGNEKVQLVLIGNKDDEFVNYARRLGLLNDTVFFRGEVSYRQVAEEMQRSHCLVLNSFMENSPCVIGEALCCGLPVIATNVGGIPELVNDKNSVLVPSNDTEALVKAMEKVYHNYSSFSPKAIAGEASKKFGYAAVAGKFDEFYRAVSVNISGLADASRQIQQRLNK